MNRTEIDYDHHNAIPLSDGFHVLFTDPPTGNLCLGSDAPHGGPTKLLRKIRFEPPSEVYSSEQPKPATLYAAGRDLTYGVRIVAIHGPYLVYYSVPEDMLADINRINGHLIGETEPNPDHWSHWVEHTFVPLPIRLEGHTISQMSNVVDIAIQGGREPIIWAFCSEGLARTFKVGPAPYVERHAIDCHGSVVDVLDEQGDRTMHDAPSEPPSSSGKGKDKTTSVPGAFRDSDNDIEMIDEPSEALADPWLIEPTERTRFADELTTDDRGREWLNNVPTPLDDMSEPMEASALADRVTMETCEVPLYARHQGVEGGKGWKAHIVRAPVVAGYWNTA